MIPTKDPVRYGGEYMLAGSPESVETPEIVWYNFLRQPLFELDAWSKEILQTHIDDEIHMGRLPPNTTLRSYFDALRKVCGWYDEQAIADVFEKVTATVRNLEPQTTIGEDIQRELIDFLESKATESEKRLDFPQRHDSGSTGFSYEVRSLADLARKKLTLTSEREI